MAQSNAHTFAQQFIDILVKRSAIESDKAAAFKKVFAESNKPSIINFLLQEGLVDRGNLLNALSDYYRVPAFDTIGYFFDQLLVRQIPKDVLLRNAMIPLQVDENILIVIASQPDNPELLSTIGQYVSYPVRFMVGIEQDITDAVKEFYDNSLTQIPESDLKDKQRMRNQAEDIIIEDEDQESE